jgi:hypothetical protein
MMSLPPFVLVQQCLRYYSDRWQYQRLVHGAFTTLKYLSPNDLLGPTGLGNEGGSSGLLNKKKKGKENRDSNSNKNAMPSPRADGLGNTDANL